MFPVGLTSRIHSERTCPERVIVNGLVLNGVIVNGLVLREFIPQGTIYMKKQLSFWVTDNVAVADKVNDHCFSLGSFGLLSGDF